MPDRVVIIGLGYVGLPLACLCALKGYKTYGLELDEPKIKKINQNISPIKDEFIQKTLKKIPGKIFATNDSKILQTAKIIIVCGPTPVNEHHEPDLSAIKKSCQTISENLQKNQLIIIESTIYPGTIEEIIKPVLEQSGLKCEKDFFLAHCPERIDPGNQKWVIENIPRVLGGLSETGAKKAKKFYESIISAKITQLNNARQAEAVKMIENTFRDINIAFVNELAKSFPLMGLDIKEVIEGAKTKPFGFMAFYPGPGVGGHCIGVDPYYLIAKARQKGFEHKFLSLAREINNSMPGYVVELAEKLVLQLGKNFIDSKISILGVAYKADVDDFRESPSLEVINMLKQKGAKPVVFDPFIPNQSNTQSIEDAVKAADIVLLLTKHKQFLEKLSPAFLKKNNIKAIIDSHNGLNKEEIIKSGIIYSGIGR